MNTNLHIVPHDGEWAVRWDGKKKPIAIHSTQEAAIAAALELADDEDTSVVVHRQDGTFRNVISHEMVERLDRDDGSRGFLECPLVWGIFAAGALAGLATYLILHPPAPVKRWID